MSREVIYGSSTPAQLAEFRSAVNDSIRSGHRYFNEHIERDSCEADRCDEQCDEGMQPDDAADEIVRSREALAEEQSGATAGHQYKTREIL